MPDTLTAPVPEVDATQPDRPPLKSFEFTRFSDDKYHANLEDPNDTKNASPSVISIIFNKAGLITSMCVNYLPENGIGSDELTHLLGYATGQFLKWKAENNIK